MRVDRARLRNYIFVATSEGALRWTWDPAKDRTNRRKHGIGFATAALVFDDPLSLSRPDTYPDEERWQTVGLIGAATVLVVHTAPQPGQGGERPGRIIGARKAAPRERKAYEEGRF
jgi:uncharacterized DUF497 family protein